MPRQSGYAVTIHGFIEVPKNDLDRQIKSAQAVKEAIASGDIKGLFDLMKLDPDGVSQKFITRNDPHPPAQLGLQGGDQARISGVQSDADAAPGSRRGRQAA